MIIRFGLAFDGLRPRLPENPVDDVVLGPAGLLGVLESQLGLPPVSAQPGEALLAYRTCLEEADAAAVEQLAMDRVPRGRGQRLQQVAAALVASSPRNFSLKKSGKSFQTPSYSYTKSLGLTLTRCPRANAVRA